MPPPPTSATSTLDRVVIGHSVFLLQRSFCCRYGFGPGFCNLSVFSGVWKSVDNFLSPTEKRGNRLFHVPHILCGPILQSHSSDWLFQCFLTIPKIFFKNSHRSYVKGRFSRWVFVTDCQFRSYFPRNAQNYNWTNRFAWSGENI